MCPQQTFNKLCCTDIEEPTVRMTFGVSTSPFMGKDGEHCTSRNLRDRLFRELRTNVSLQVEPTASSDVFVVAGRGELHLSILVETMRREQFEFQVSRPEPVTKVIDGKTYEPYEVLNISTSDEYMGALSEYLAGRLAQLRDMRYDDNGNVHLEYKIPTRGLIGFNSFFLRTCRVAMVLTLRLRTNDRMRLAQSRRGETATSIPSWW